MAITEQEILDSLKAICEKRDDGKTKGATFELMKLSCDLDWLVGFILEEIKEYSFNSYPVHHEERVETLKRRFKNYNEMYLVISDIADYLNNTQWKKIFPPKTQINKSNEENLTEGQRLAEFCKVVHLSSLKRFNQVAQANRAWRPSLNQLSFADILKHLVDADRWILAILKNSAYVPKADVKPEDGREEQWEEYLNYWEKLFKEKYSWLWNATEKDLFMEVRRENDESKWNLLMRGNLDHEIHHRGALQVMLRMKYNP